MLKQTPKKRVLFVRRYSLAPLALFGVFCLVLVNTRAPQIATAAAVNSTVNFQARLQTASGGIVPDDSYNVEFKLYAASTGGTALWTEDYLNSGTNGLDTVNGYLSTALGSVTPFPTTINWNQQLWVTMNIGGTTGGTPSWDGEMDPRLQLTAVPYAFQANQLAQSNSGDTLNSTLSIQAPTVGNQNFVIQDQGASGTFNLLTQDQSDTRYIQLQGSSPGSAQTGNINISGQALVGGVQVSSGGSVSISNGSLTLGGSNMGSYTSPQGNTVNAKISLPNIDPGTSGQVIAVGISSGADSTARGVAVYDNRSGSHQPSIAVLSPDESKIFGLSWDGSNSIAVLKTTSNTAAIQVNGVNGLTVTKSGSTTATTIGVSSSSDGIVTIANAGNGNTVSIEGTGTSGSYTINLPSAIGSAGQCLVVSSVASSVETLGHGSCGGGSSPTLQDVYDNSSTTPLIQLGATGGGIAIQDASTTVGGNLFAIQNHAGTTDYLAVTTTGVDVANALNVSASSSGTHNTATLGNFIQGGAGDATVQLATSDHNFFVGVDESAGGVFKISSAAASDPTNTGDFDSFDASLFSLTETGAAAFQNSTNSSTAFQIQDSDANTVFDVDTTNKYVGIGTNAPSHDFDIAVNNSNTTSLPVLIEQGGAGDTGVEFKNSSISFYQGIDATDGSFKINSSVNGGSSSEMGYHTVGGSKAVGPQNTIDSTRYTATSTGTISTIYVYVGEVDSSPHNLGQAAIYADSSGAPGTLLASSSDTTLIPDSWNAFTISSTSVTSGTNYWLGYNTNTSDSNKNDFFYDSGTSNQSAYTSQTYGTWPSTWSAGYASVKVSVYAVIDTTGSDNFAGSLFQLTSSGAAKFQNASNSTAALTVQNAANTSLFTVDTTDNQVVIGPSAGDTNGTLLVLGKKTGSASDPTGTNGAMYYNVTSNSFRCYENGVWRSCIGGLVNSSTSVSSAIASSTTKTDFSGGTNNSYGVLANDCQPGVTYLITANGVYSTTGTPSLTMSLDEDSTSTALLAGPAFVAPSGASNYGWQLNAQMTCDDTTHAEIQGSLTYGNNNSTPTASTTFLLPSTSTATWSTSSHTLYIGAQWSANSASNTITMRQFIVQRMGP